MKIAPSEGQARFIEQMAANAQQILTDGPAALVAARQIC
tara:strand:- start:2034 stop:2150 length:117 start_codon:yes stop_codon:yes gene_type:complete